MGLKNVWSEVDIALAQPIGSHQIPAFALGTIFYGFSFQLSTVSTSLKVPKETIEVVVSEHPVHKYKSAYRKTKNGNLFKNSCSYSFVYYKTKQEADEALVRLKRVMDSHIDREIETLLKLKESLK